MRTLIASIISIVLAYLGQVEAQPHVQFYNLSESHTGRVADAAALYEVLIGLGAVPAGSEPIVVSVHSLDSNLGIMAESIEMYQTIISEVAARIGAEPPVFVAAPWGRPENRALRGSKFPTSPEELQSANYSFLVDPAGFELVWDVDGEVAELVAGRGRTFGAEQLRGVNLFLCVDGEGVTGWASSRAYRNPQQPTMASIGRFTEDCIAGNLDLTDSYTLSPEFLEQFGISDRWFAVLLPDAFDGLVDPLDAVNGAELILQQARIDIPLFTMAVETLSADFMRFVPADEHAEALRAMGVELNEEFQRAAPAWMVDLVTHNGSILVLFDDSGEAVAPFAAAFSDPTGRETLLQALLRLGLF